MFRRRQAFADLTTTALAISYVENRKNLERCRKGGSLWEKVFRRILRLKPNTRKLQESESRLRVDAVAQARELQTRFDGLLREMLERTMDPQTPSEDDLREFLLSVWLGVEATAVSLRDAEAFFAFFWRHVEFNLETRINRKLPPAVIALKPKFMLRQFVDEIPSAEQRAVLCALAYDPGPADVRSDRAQLEMLEAAYRSLHAVLWVNRDQLSRRTEREIVVTAKKPSIATLARYERYFFVR